MRIFTRIQEYVDFKSSANPGNSEKYTETKKIKNEFNSGSPLVIEEDQSKPAPKAKASDVVKRFIAELKDAESEIEFDIAKLKQRYED